MTSCFPTVVLKTAYAIAPVLLQCRVLLNTPDVLYWLHLALNDGGRQD